MEWNEMQWKLGNKKMKIHRELLYFENNDVVL